MILSQAGAPDGRPSWAPRPDYDPSDWNPMPAWQRTFDPRSKDEWRPPSPPKEGRRIGCVGGCLIALALGVAGLVVVVVLAMTTLTSTVGPALVVAEHMQTGSKGEIRSVTFNSFNGVGTFDIRLAPNVDPAEAARLACGLVRQSLSGTQFAEDHFAIYNSDGYLVADWRTACG